MFARFLEMTIKPVKRSELIKKTKDEILPIFKKHTSFVDLIPLEGCGSENVEQRWAAFYAVTSKKSA